MVDGTEAKTGYDRGDVDNEWPFWDFFQQLYHFLENGSNIDIFFKITDDFKCF